MDWWNDFDGRVENHVPLSPLTWFGLGGEAECVISPRGEGPLARLVRQAAAMGVPWRVLGGGANVLIRDNGVDGVVVRLDDDAFTQMRSEGEIVIAGGGVDLIKLCNQCAGWGLAGLECMAGIPGTVGGAIRMNAGGRFGQIADHVDSVRVMRPDGQVQTLTPEQVGFGYRRTCLGRSIVLEARFRLRREDPHKVQGRLREYWAWKKDVQPFAEHSAGCIFKNPPGDSAGRLIDRAGLKGAAQGNARVSDQHANFIVAGAGATAADVLRLVERIRNVVRDKFGVELELEIDIW